MPIRGSGQNFIDGARVGGGAGTLEVEDPAPGEALAEQALADAGDVERAVQAARRIAASGALTAMRPAVRGRMVRRIGDQLLERIDEIALLLTRESGKPLWEARVEIKGAARYSATSSGTRSGLLLPRPIPSSACARRRAPSSTRGSSATS